MLLEGDHDDLGDMQIKPRLDLLLAAWLEFDRLLFRSIIFNDI